MGKAKPFTDEWFQENEERAQKAMRLARVDYGPKKVEQPSVAPAPLKKAKTRKQTDRDEWNDGMRILSNEMQPYIQGDQPFDAASPPQHLSPFSKEALTVHKMLSDLFRANPCFPRIKFSP